MGWEGKQEVLSMRKTEGKKGKGGDRQKERGGGENQRERTESEGVVAQQDNSGYTRNCKLPGMYKGDQN